jgi:hypothetical protein
MKAYYVRGKHAFPELLDKELKFMADYLIKLNSREETVSEAYRVITTRFEAGKIAFTKFLDVLSTGWQDVLSGIGLVTCTNQANLLAALLVRSGKFTEDNVERRWSSIWGLIPHRYLNVKLDDLKFIELDPWAAKYGLPIGDHARGWHTGKRRKKDLSNLKI